MNTAQLQSRNVKATMLSLLIGALLVGQTFPMSFLFLSSELVLKYDAAQHVIAQRYFIGDAWRWPLLHIATLGVPDGSNLAFLDGIPAFALFLKVFRSVLPSNYQGVTLFYGLVFLLQPAAGVWALRGTGESRLGPLLAVAVLAACSPALWNRFGHAALCSHGLLLIAIGLYLRLVTRPSQSLWAIGALLAGVALLIHPYMMAMVMALLVAVPATLLLRGDRRWLWSVGGVFGCCIVVSAVLTGLGYIGAQGASGYGKYALNLLSPVWPAGSIFFPSLKPVDATGSGGWEGYNYLGAGVLLGAAATLQQPQELWKMLIRHAGLMAVLAGLTLLALSSRVGLGSVVLFDLGPPPAFLEQFRGSGRFFWPVGYAILVGVVARIARAPARRQVVVLSLVAALQFVDTLPIRRSVADAAQHASRSPSADATVLAPLLSGATLLTLLPSWVCGPPRAEDIEVNQSLLLDIIGLAAPHQLAVSTMYSARYYGALRCTDQEQAKRPLAPGELRVILPAGQGSLIDLVPDAKARCRWLGALVVCSDSSPGDLRPVLTPGRLWSFYAMGAGTTLLHSGWAAAEPWGVWSDGPRASLHMQRRNTTAGALRLDWTVMGFASSGSAEQRVAVFADGKWIDEWMLPDRQVVQRSLTLTALTADAPLILEFRVDTPSRPVSRSLGNDNRALGLALISLQSQPLATVP